MPEENAASRTDLLELTAEIVAAYVSNNPLPSSEIGRVIADTYAAISNLHGRGAPPPEEKSVPAVPIKKSVMPDFIICLEDGKKFKSLKRHLATSHDLTPDDYRARWNLPADYPMVAPNYAATRSQLARASGLGRKATEPLTPQASAKRRKPGV